MERSVNPVAFGMSSTPLYSICITSYNALKTVRQSLKSILDQLDSTFEVVVVDNFSNDGSLQILQEYEKSGMIRLILKSCNRGIGRQAAVDHSEGDYILVNVDLDTVYRPILQTVTKAYQKYFDGYLMQMHGYGICPRDLAIRVGGYRDLQYAEDFDFYSRCAKAGKLKYLDLNNMVTEKPHGEGSLRHRIVYKYYRARDLFRLDMNPFAEMSWKSTILNGPIIATGYLGHFFKERYTDRTLAQFRIWDFLEELPPELAGLAQEKT